jgi:hypothetical protein
MTTANRVHFYDKKTLEALKYPHPRTGLALYDGGRRFLVETGSDGSQSPTMTLSGDEKGGMKLSPERIAIFDSEDSPRAVLGSVGLATSETGATEQTAPGSLTLFNRKGKVIWQAP